MRYDRATLLMLGLVLLTGAAGLVYLGGVALATLGHWLVALIVPWWHENGWVVLIVLGLLALGVYLALVMIFCPEALIIGMVGQSLRKDK